MARIRILLPIALLALMLTAPVQGAAIPENTISDWMLAVNNTYALQTFDNLSFSWGTSSITALDSTMGNATVTGLSGNGTVKVYDETSALYTWMNWGGNGKILAGAEYDPYYNTNSPNGLRVAFANNAIYAVFMDVMVGATDTNGSAEIRMADGTVAATLTTSPRPTRTSIGFVSDAPISYVDVVNLSGRVAGSDTYIIIDNLYYSTTQPTVGGGGGGGGTNDPPPVTTDAAEPATLFFIGSGLVALYYKGRRSRMIIG